MLPAIRFCAVAALGLTLSACSMGNMFGGGGGTQDFANASASPSQVAAAAPDALPAIATECPPIKIRPGAEAIFNYGGAAIDARNLHYQAVIDKQSRNCVVSNGLITVKMGVVGRFMLGPAGNQTSIDLPLRFAVERDSAALFSEKYSVPVQLPASSQATDFVKVVENVQIPYVTGDNITIWVGFDSKG
jgi:hypothetical protein